MIGNNNARQTATLRGDSLYYNPGSTYIQKVAGSGTAGQVIVTTNPAYAITEGTVALTSNYALTYVGAGLEITARPITVTADAKSKVYGDADPALTYRMWMQPRRSRPDL